MSKIGKRYTIQNKERGTILSERCDDGIKPCELDIKRAPLWVDYLNEVEGGGWELCEVRKEERTNG